jgi:hypothetical protein
MAKQLKSQKPQFTQSCRVKDKMKVPKPGDDIVFGTLTQLDAEEFTILMDDGKIRSGPIAQLDALFEVVPK